MICLPASVSCCLLVKYKCHVQVILCQCVDSIVFTVHQCWCHTITEAIVRLTTSVDMICYTSVSVCSDCAHTIQFFLNFFFFFFGGGGCMLLQHGLYIFTLCIIIVSIMNAAFRGRLTLSDRLFFLFSKLLPQYLAPVFRLLQVFHSGIHFLALCGTELSMGDVMHCRAQRSCAADTGKVDGTGASPLIDSFHSFLL